MSGGDKPSCWCERVPALEGDELLLHVPGVGLVVVRLLELPPHDPLCAY